MHDDTVVLFGADAFDLLALSRELAALFRTFGVAGRVTRDEGRIVVTVTGPSTQADLCLQVLPTWYLRFRRGGPSAWEYPLRAW